MPAILFIIILGIIVFFHELGHFLVAKKNGVRVDEFGLGFPPRILGWKYGQTTYSINLIPFGGFVKIFGEELGGEKTENRESLASKSKGVQAAVAAAGVIFNILFAWLILSAGFAFGLPTEADGPRGAEIRDAKLVITAVLPGSPAENAGLKAGDQIIAINGKNRSDGGQSAETARNFIATTPENETLTVVLKREDENRTISVAPIAGLIEGKKAIGVSFSRLGILKLPLYLAPIEGARATYVMTKNVAFGIAGLIKDAVTGRAELSSLTGPVGIAGMAGQAEKMGFGYLISFTAFISINLAVLNLLPFPALDGGRLLFIILEKIRRKPIKAKIANTLNQIGFALLIILMAVVTIKDIAGFF